MDIFQNNLCKQTRILWSVFLIYVWQSFYHRSAAISMILVWGVRIGVTVVLYHGIYKILGGGTIRNISYEVAVSSILLGMIYAGFGGREISRVITPEYKAGVMSVWLNKPISYSLLKVAEVTGKSMPTALGLIGCSIIFWSIGSNLPHVDHLVLRSVCGLVLLILGMIIAICLNTMVGLSTVFLQESAPVFAIVDKLAMLFGGIYIPMGLLPHWLRFAGESSPMGAAILVNQTFYPDFFINFPRFIVTQIAWLVVSILALRFMIRVANRHMTVNGG